MPTPPNPVLDTLSTAVGILTGVATLFKGSLADRSEQSTKMKLELVQEDKYKEERKRLKNQFKEEMDVKRM